MRSASLLLAAVALVPVIACDVSYGYGPPPVNATVQVQPPPPQPVTAQVDVNTQQPVDQNVQPQPQPQQTDPNQGADQLADTDASAVGDFRDVLAPYGTWMDHPQYGTIWVPNANIVGPDFTPYLTAGHWTYDNDYTWVSDWDWGWAPFHYGRWFQAPGVGWAWIPGKEYAGAWVTWRNGDDGYGYVGWAPTPPNYYWRGGSPVTIQTAWYQPRYSYIETGNLFQPTFRTNIIRDPGRVSVIENRTRVYAPSGTAVVGGNTRMTIRGPALNRLGINASVVPRAPVTNPNMQRAFQFNHQRAGVTVGGGTGRTVTPTHPPFNEGRGQTEQRGTMQAPQQQGRNQQTEQRGTMQAPQQQTRNPETEQRGTMQAPQQQQGQVVQQQQSQQRPQVQPQPTATAVRRYVPPEQTHSGHR